MLRRAPSVGRSAGALLQRLRPRAAGWVTAAAGVARRSAALAPAGLAEAHRTMADATAAPPRAESHEGEARRIRIYTRTGDKGTPPPPSVSTGGGGDTPV